MNLEESDSFKSELERNARSKRNVIISLVFCSFLIVLLVALIAILKYQDSITNKMFVNGKQVTIPVNFNKTIDGENYVNIKALGELLGYNYTKGIYGEYTEDDDSCYLRNNFEVIAITAGADKYTKYLELSNGGTAIGSIPKVILKNPNGYNESYKLEKPVKFEDGVLYIAQEYITDMFNIQATWEEYRINFFTLEYFETLAQKTLKSKGFADMSTYYENIKALMYGYIIVGNGQAAGKSTEYGVISLSNGQEIISTKYDEIVFVQKSREFYITAANGTVGIFDKEGKTIISLSEFEKISLLDEENKLYLVEKSGEYGILNRQGQIVLYAEYDKIGIDTTAYVYDKVENTALLFGKCIPVQKNNKYGLYDENGNCLLDVVYDGFGYKSPIKSAASGNEQSVLLIPSEVGINGIVVNLDDKYGIFDINVGGLIFPTVFDKIYSVQKEGERIFYASYNGQEMELSQYLKEMNLNNVDENGKLLTANTSTETTNVPEETVQEENSEEINVEQPEVQE